MKRLVLFALFSGIACHLFGIGVVIPDSSFLYYLPLKSSMVHVSVDGQVAITVASQVYYNNTGDSTKIQYAFPMPVEASALSLRYKISGQWFEANFSAKEQDSITSGSSEQLDENLIQYLGENPLIYTIDQVLHADSMITVELTYVELLEYKLGNVYYSYPNNYGLISSYYDQVSDFQEFIFDLESERTINDIIILSHTADSIDNSGNSAAIFFKEYEASPNQDYRIQYSLSLDELGLFGFSTYLPDSIVPDNHGQGYFLFIAEPDPLDQDLVIDKVFTFIIDRSGSMSGDKIVQARNAAKFIVENLNLGDKFNIVDFSDEIRTFRSDHVAYHSENEDAALAYIDQLSAGGSTNISGTFGTSIPQFSAATENTANIIIFFTDGQQTSGITDTDELLNYVDNLVVLNEAKIMVFTFGIGTSTNERLLTTLAANNYGLAEFLGADQLEEKITEFYLMIRNPVLLNTGIEMEPELLKEIYPSRLPNLYIGQQMILAGRYEDAADFSLQLNGKAFGSQVSYEYFPELSDSAVIKNSFVPKIWAKKKIEKLLTDYYLLNSSLEEAQRIKDEIIDISLTYRVLSPFTSFQGSSRIEYDSYLPFNLPGVAVFEDIEFKEAKEYENQLLQLVGTYPNPFSEYTSIRFRVLTDIDETAVVRIFDLAGRLIAEYEIRIDGPDDYELRWDPSISHPDLPSGAYTCRISIGDEKVSATLIYRKE